MLALDDIKALGSPTPVTYSYTLGAGLALLMEAASVEPDEAVIARWCTTLGLPCKSVFNRDYAYYVSSLEKFEQMSQMFAQMEASAKRQEAERAAVKAKAAAAEAEAAEKAAAEEA